MSVPGKVVDLSPPASVDTEQVVLGTMILNPDTIDTVLARLTPESFFQPPHQMIFRAIADLSSSGVVVDFHTVLAELERRRQLEEVGGGAYVLSLENQVFSPENVEQHAEILYEKHQLRELMRAAGEIGEEARAERGSVTDIIDRAEQRMFELRQRRLSDGFLTMNDLNQRTLEEIERRSSSEHEFSGVATGFRDLDDMTGGLQRSDLIILAARPSMGKTAFALNMALGVAGGWVEGRFRLEQRKPVAFLSLEMSATQVHQRLLSTVSRVSTDAMRKGTLSKEQRQGLKSWTDKLQQIPVYVDDTPGLSIAEMRAKVRRLARQEKDLGMVMVDYLQLMRGAGRTENRQQEIAEISRSLKALARELNVPIVALSQLSRLVEQRKGKHARPMLSDLRESGAIEQDADVVMFIHRERNFDKKQNDEDKDAQRRNQSEVAEIIIGKQRNGPVGKVELVFFESTATFHNLARPHGTTPDDDPGY